MFRTTAFIGLALMTVGGALAGTVIPINLTTQQVGTVSCASCTPTVTSTSAGSFENFMFTATLGSGTTVSPSPNPQTPPDSPAAFDLVAQTGSTNNGDDTFVSTNNTSAVESTAILIDLGTCTGVSATGTCGLYNVDDLYTLLQAADSFGVQGVTITLNGSAANGTALTPDVIDLTSGLDYRAYNSKLTVTCTVANPGTSGCTGESSDTASTSHQDTTSTVLGNNTVTVYNNIAGVQTNGTKNFYLDAQELGLGGQFLNGYLDSVLITYTAPSTGGQLIFSGLSADVPGSAPEPDTLAMLGIGIGLVGVWKARGRRSKKPTVD